MSGGSTSFQTWLKRCLRQYVTLCWKNFLLEHTHYVIIPAQVILPTVMIIVVFAIRQTTDAATGNATSYPDFVVSHGDIFYKGSQMERPWVVAYCSNDNRAHLVMQIVNQRLMENSSTSQGEGRLFIPSDAMFENETSMVDFMMKNSTYRRMVMAGVVFDINNDTESDGVLHVTYKLRFAAEQNWKASDKSSWVTDSWYETEPTMAPRNTYFRGSLNRPGYLREGFLFLQRYIDDAIIDLATRSQAPMNRNLYPFENVQLQMFPYPEYKSDEFLDVIKKYLPLFVIISFVINATFISKEVTLEKEKKLKESMRLMGLKVWINWLAWFTKFFLFVVVSVSVITLFLHVRTPRGGVFHHGDPSVTFVFLLLYAVSVVAFSFMMSSVVSKSNVAAAATAILYLLSYVPFYFLQLHYKDLSVASKVILSLFNNLAMAFGCVQFSRAEALGIGLQWSNVGDREMAQDEMTLMHLMILLVVDIVLYSVLTWYFDAIFPGDFGVPQPLYFPFTPWYWCGHGTMEGLDRHYDHNHFSEAFERPEKDKRVGVRIRGLTKIFNENQKPAVSNMNLDLYEGNITVFLGHNGAGKTTTMFMLTGFLKPTTGTAIINGHDISKNMDKVRQSLGLCPQHNILFDTLTVEQHLYFFAQLKGCPSDEIPSEVDGMIRTLKLEGKRFTYARALSGGMKRKLSIAIALIGGSKFVILDEPTSGMDPESRRQTWEMLQRERRGRTVILSTHFMDEADLLGDRIAVVSKGVVECYGSPIFLKSRYGIGYHLTIVKSLSAVSSSISDLVTEHIEEAQFEGEMGAELTYLLPKNDSRKISKLFRAIESNREQLGIDSFGASVTTMEEVFIKVAERSSASNDPLPYNVKCQGRDAADVFEVSPGHRLGRRTQDGPTHLHSFQSVPFVRSNIRGRLLQLQGLFVKRAINTWRDTATTVFQLLLPLVFAILACVAIHTQPKRADMPPLPLEYPRVGPVSSLARYKTPYYVTPGSSAAWIRCMGIVFPSSETERVNVSRAINRTFLYDERSQESVVDRYLMSRAKHNLYKYQKHYLTAIEVLKDYKTLRGFFNDESFHAIAVTANKLSNMRLCAAVQGRGGGPTPSNRTHRIRTINHPLPWRKDSRLIGISTIDNMFLIGAIFSNSIAFGVGLAVGTYVLFVVGENSSGAKHIQFLSGVGPLPFWATTLAWDAINYLLVVLSVVFVVLTFGTEAYYDNIGYVILLLVFYFWSMLPIIYCISLFVRVPSNGYIIVAVVNIFTGTVSNLAISIMKYPTFDVYSVAQTLEWIFYVVFPNFCLNRGLFDLYFNHQSIDVCNSLDEELTLPQICNMSREYKETNPCCPDLCGHACLFRTSNYLDLNSPGIGRPVLFMGIQGVLFYTILLLVEYLGQDMFKRRKRKVPTIPWESQNACASEATNETEVCYIDSNNTSLNDPALKPPYPLPHHAFETEDDDVFEEKRKTLSMLTKTIRAGEYALVLSNVTKFYKYFLAVDRLSLTVPKGECFGLLGVNGAGKTTTFKMMTGSMPTSGGEIYIEGLNVATERRAAQSLIGYCPQFDALIDQMTVEETLTFYARLRKVEPKATPYVVDDLIDVLLLRPHAGKKAGNLSGGNKRKLSIGIALIGNPPIVFLDEPTTGMDPAARRKLWNTLSAVRESGKTIVLTSHSMEECEALCTRLAIMVNGRFKCLGSTQHLKSKFGGGYSVSIKLKPNKKKELLECYARHVVCFMDKVFPGNLLKDKHEGLLHFQVDTPGLTWGRIFMILERAKEHFEIEDYSVGQTTLEQLFINFAKTQRDR